MADDEFDVKCMKKKGLNEFVWPEKTDMLTCPMSDVLCLVSDPVNWLMIDACHCQRMTVMLPMQRLVATGISVNWLHCLISQVLVKKSEMDNGGCFEEVNKRNVSTKVNFSLNSMLGR